MEEVKTEFVLDGDGIKYRLQVKGLTQENLAEALGLTQGSVSQKLNGSRGCSLSEACVIADVLDCRLDAIVKEA